MAEMTKEQIIKQVADHVLPILRTEVAPVVADVVEEKVAKSFEAQAAATVAAAQAQQPLDPTDLTQPQCARKATQYLMSLARVARGAKTVGIPKALEAALTKTQDPWVQKAVSSTSFSEGGSTIPMEYGGFVESLSAKAVTRAHNPRVMRMASDTLTLGNQTSQATAHWHGETSRVDSSQPGTGSIQLQLKECAVIVPISNRFLDVGGSAGVDWVQRDAEKVLAIAEDDAFLRSPGTVYRPTGLKAQAASGNFFDITHAAAAATVDEIMLDLGKVIMKLANADCPMMNCGWTVSQRVKYHLKSLLNASNLPLFPELQTGDNLLGFPLKATTRIPNNLGGGDESEVYFADYESIVIGQREEMSVDFYPGGTYWNATTGAMESGISNNQTVMAMRLAVDIKSLYNGADIAGLTAVDWGA
jgi:HK97 family phage major capsid protein